MMMMMMIVYDCEWHSIEFRRTIKRMVVEMKKKIEKQKE